MRQYSQVQARAMVWTIRKLAITNIILLLMLVVGCVVSVNLVLGGVG